ncbi:hypothetical protein HAX54_019750, partial [Datura stramonium]|nr:hypothetical protein [Datura stramonium]
MWKKKLKYDKSGAYCQRSKTSEKNFLRLECCLGVVPGAMTSRAKEKDKEVAISSKGLEGLKKGVTPSSSALKVPPTRRFRAQAVEEHGLN